MILNCFIRGNQLIIFFFVLSREYGLEKFVPISLLETMKRKELIKLLNQLIKQNQALSGPGHKQLSATQAKFHYLKIVSDLPSYGAKSFATCSKVRTMIFFIPFSEWYPSGNISIMWHIRCFVVNLKNIIRRPRKVASLERGFTAS